MLVMDDNFRANLMKASTVEEFLGYIDQAEKEKFEAGGRLYHNRGIFSVSHTVSGCPARKVGTFAPGEGYQVR